MNFQKCQNHGIYLGMFIFLILKYLNIFFILAVLDYLYEKTSEICGDNDNDEEEQYAAILIEKNELTKPILSPNIRDTIKSLRTLIKKFTRLPKFSEALSQIAPTKLRID